MQFENSPLAPSAARSGAFNGLDPSSFGIIVAIAAVIIASLFFFLRAKLGTTPPTNEPGEADGGVVGQANGTAAAGGRQPRVRLGAMPQRPGTNGEQDDGVPQDTDETAAAARRGALDPAARAARRAAAQEAELDVKQQKKAEREARAAEREADAERREKAEADALQALREEKKTRSNAEFQQWASMISVESKGEVHVEDPNVVSKRRREALLPVLITAKIAVLDDIARSQASSIELLVSDIEALMAEGQLSGVFDDRGKFVVVEAKEYDAIARFIRQRGRVSLSEITTECNRVIVG